MELHRTEEKRQLRVSILGSCVSRDAFSLSKNAPSYTDAGIEYTVERFVQSIQPLSAISAPVPTPLAERLLEESRASAATNFYKRNFMLDVKKSWEDYLFEVHSDWLILDLSTVRLSVRPVAGTYITHELEVASTKGLTPAEGSALASLADEEIRDLFDLPTEELHAVLSEYFDRILAHYPAERIILLDIHHVYTYLDPETGLLTTPADKRTEARYRAEDRIISAAYDYAKQYLRGAYFVDALPLLIGNARHVWGRCGLHYLDEIYLYMLRAIECITAGEGSRDEREQEVCRLRCALSAEVFAAYAAAANRTAERAHNRLNVERGLLEGNYEKNGLSVTVNADRSFAVTGRATEDTVLYLHSRHGDPTGNWASLATDLPAGPYRITTDVEKIPDRVTLQLVLTAKGDSQRWIAPDRAQGFTLTEPAVYALARLLVKAGVEVDLCGRLLLERLR